MTALYEDRAAASAAAEKLKVFAQPQRLMILSCLLAGERNVGELAERTQITQPALSQQLAELRRAELVRSRKEAKQVWYALADEQVAQCVRNLEALFGDGELKPVERPASPPPASTSPRAGAAGFARTFLR